MKNLLFLMVLVLTPTLLVNAQTVAINTDSSTSSDAKAMLEIKKEDYSKLKIRTTSFSDTAVLELSNRDIFGLGTDFLFSQIGESGLVLSSRSDLIANTNDSIMTFKPDGSVFFRSLRGTGTRMLMANSSGQILTNPQTHAISISSSSFQPRSGSGYANFTSSDVNGMAQFSTGTSSFVVAPVSLPDGAVISSLKAYFVDNSVRDISFSLFRSSITNSTNIVATVTSTGASGNNNTISMLENFTIGSSLRVVDNSTYFYYINAGPPGACCWDGDQLRIKGIVITYML